jgi:hypothetical protein
MNPNSKPDWFKIFDTNLKEAVGVKNTKEYGDQNEFDKIDTEVQKTLDNANFDYKNEKNIDNVYGQSFLMGYYTEMKDPKNAEKTVDELKDIVLKNMVKDVTYYNTKASFGVKDIGYTKDVVGGGDPVAPKGKHKSSGYGDMPKAKTVKEGLNESYDDMYGVDGEDENEAIRDKQNKTTYSIYLGHEIIYTSLPIERLKSVLYSLENDLGEDLEDFMVRKNGTNIVKPANELGWDLSNIKSFDNIPSLKNKIDNIANSVEEGMGKVKELIRHEIVRANGKKEIVNLDKKFNKEGPFKDAEYHLVLAKGDKISPTKEGNKSLNEAAKKSNVHKRIQELEKQNEVLALESKIAALGEAINELNEKLTLMETEEMKELIDPRKKGEIQKDIKVLEKYKMTCEKKLGKGKKTVVDEVVTGENPYFDTDPSDGDADEVENSRYGAENYYDKGKKAFEEGDLEKAQEYYEYALNFGSNIGWDERELPPYETL